MNKPVIIVGPQGSGKTTNAAKLMEIFGAARLVDDWDGQTPLQDGDLALTNSDFLPAVKRCRLLTLDQALKLGPC